MTEPKRYSYIVDYYDPQANLSRSYQFLYFPEDSTIEMYDLKTKRIFLKRCAYALSAKEIFVGATINVFSRSLKVTDYGDEFTRSHFATNSGEFMLAISEKGIRQAGAIIEVLTGKDLRLCNLRLVDIPSDVASRNQTSSRCILAVFSGSNAEAKAQEVCGSHPGAVSLITDISDVHLLTEVALGPSKTTATMRDCAVCVIKPHAITSGFVGPILQRLFDEGFHVSAIGMYTMSVADAEDFLEVYNGVVPEYKKLVEQMSNAPCVAVEVCAENAVQALRVVCGPHDPEVCHVLFPHTIRSKHGVDRARNGVHCTDLEEDGPLESEFFFSLMQNKQ